ncbi:MAG: tetratricopeptide repeat protein [Acidobacteriota bacterium]
MNENKTEKIRQLNLRETKLLALLKKSPQDAKLYNDLGVVRFYLGKLTEAEIAFKRAIELDAKAVDARANLSFCYFQTNRDAAGEDMLRAALMLDPNNFLANYFTGLFYFNRNQPVRAEIYLKRAAELQPQHIEARLDLIKLYRIQKNDTEAERQLDELLLIAAKDTRVRYSRAVLYAETARYREAIREFENVLLLDSSLDEVKFELALAAFHGKEWFKAVRALEDYHTKKTTPQSIYLLGICYLKLEQVEQAVKHFQHAVELKPDLFEARFELGRIYFAKQEFNIATRELEQVLAASGENVEARYLLGYCYELLGRFGEAQEQYNELVKRAPTRFEGYHGLGSLAVRQSDASALSHLKRALELGGNNADVYYLLGRAYARASEWSKAVENFASAIKLDPSRPDIHYQLALTLKKMGRDVEAEFEFQTVEQLNKKFRTSAEGQKQ